MIIVSGASRGLGRAIAERLSARGHAVVGLARQVTDAPYPMIACDVASPEAVRDARRQIRAMETPVTGLVAAAGIASMNLAVMTPAATTRRIIDTNLIGTITCCQQFAPLMMRHKHGSIVTFSSIAVALGMKGEAIYAASKAGVEAFTRTFAREVASFNIRVNCIAPGPIETDLLRGVAAINIATLVAQQILQRQFTPDTVADLVEILFDPRSASISGTVLPVGGV